MPKLTTHLASNDSFHNRDNSNEMEEIVGQVPPWLIRWGIGVLFLVAIIALAIIRQVRFPDTLIAKVLIQAKEQPGKVTIRREDANQHFRFLVKDGDLVKVGDTLLVRMDKRKHEEEAIITPMNGKIYLSQGIDAENTLDQVIWVVPKATAFDIKIEYINEGAGKVKTGRLVKLSLYDYPSNEYGFLEGTITKILPVQIDGKHQAYVKLNKNRLITSQKHELPILPTMQGEAEILLNDRSIFERIFGSLYHYN
uniref:HlyD family secretion protein n=1 Tax=Sphingobacterium sp. (strain 21) TaxID=743722 RepID=F4C9Y5_SPHS2